MTSILTTLIFIEIEEIVQKLQQSKSIAHWDMNMEDDHPRRQAIKEIIKCLNQLDENILIHRLKPRRWLLEKFNVKYYLNKHVNDHELNRLYQHTKWLITGFNCYLKLENS